MDSGSTDDQEIQELQIASYDANASWRPTPEQYAALQWLFDFFDEKLFNGALPEVVLTLSRKGKRTLGYYQSGRWDDWDRGQTFAEICLSSDHLFYDGAQVGLTERWKEILSTLVHEMVHHWEVTVHARGASKGYHNQQWGAKMEAIGLMPSDTGKPGGKRTGRNMHHYCIPGGRFEQAFALIPESRYLPLVTSTRQPEDKPRTPSKLKYTCPVCQINCWGAPDLKVDCRKDKAEMVVAIPDALAPSPPPLETDDPNDFVSLNPRFDPADDVTLEPDPPRDPVPDPTGYTEPTAREKQRERRIYRAYVLYEVLQDEPLTVSKLMAMEGLAYSNVAAGLQDLKRSNMIQRLPSGAYQALYHCTERADQPQVPFLPCDVRLPRGKK